MHTFRVMCRRRIVFLPRCVTLEEERGKRVCGGVNMEIKNDEDLEKAAQQAGVLLQGIQDYLSRVNSEDSQSEIHKQRCEKARVRWPRGFWIMLKPSKES